MRGVGRAAIAAVLETEAPIGKCSATIEPSPGRALFLEFLGDIVEPPRRDGSDRIHAGGPAVVCAW
jgi:hypothetical protein